MATSRSNNMLPDHLMYKNKLQEYTQQSGLSTPMYQTINEGLAHAPKFRATVFVAGRNYTSKSLYPCQKSAEQDAAKLAYESVTAELKDEACPLIYQVHVKFRVIFINELLLIEFFTVSFLYQRILYIASLSCIEYAVKVKFNIPKYKTTVAAGPCPVFVSSMDFNGKTYTGEVARNKKEAEQLVAGTAIESLLDSGPLVQIIKSKKRLFHSLPALKKPVVCEGISALAAKPENSSCQQASSVHRTVVTFSSDGPDDDRTLAKRKAETKNWQQRKRK